MQREHTRSMDLLISHCASPRRPMQPRERTSHSRATCAKFSGKENFRETWNLRPTVEASAALWVSGARPLSHVRLFASPMDCNPPGSSVHGIPQARMLEWVAISSWDLPDPGIEPASLVSPALADRFFTTSATWEALGLEDTCF